MKGISNPCLSKAPAVIISGGFDRSGHNGWTFFEKSSFFYVELGVNIYSAFAES
jgi:hypothetical protein